MPIDVRAWLLDGDVSIAYQVARDLTETSPRQLTHLQRRIEREGWGKGLLKRRNPNGHWGKGPYQPKWTSTHYTLLELKDMGISPQNAACRDSSSLMLNYRNGKAGGINYFVSLEYSDVCVNGMLLNFASYFSPKNPGLNDVVDFLLDSRMNDGGWNCNDRRGATHSSLHTTVSVLEGFDCFLKSGSTYRAGQIGQAIENAVEFLLRHRLFRSHRSGAVIDRKMLRLPYPPRWRYDILRALDCLRSLRWKYDERLTDALDVLMGKRTDDGRWPLESPHKGHVHFQTERVNRPSRWNTLRALRVLNHFGIMQQPFS